MNSINDNDIQKQINSIKQEAEQISVPDRLSPKRMMEYIDEMEARSCFEERKNNIKRNNRNKWIATFTGIAATILVTLLSVGVLMTNPDIHMDDNATTGDENIISTGDNDSKVTMNVVRAYEDKLKIDNDKGIYTLSGYKELGEYLCMIESMKVSQNDYLYGYDWIEDGMVGEDFIEESEGDVSLPGDDASTSEVPNDYSDTNTRTEGIAEADAVKTDGKYIYYLGKGYDSMGMELTIVKADGKDSHKMTSLGINSELVRILSEEESITIQEDETIQGVELRDAELMIYEDMLMIITKPAIYTQRMKGDEPYTYYYDSEMTVILTYDISDRTTPKLYSELTVEGEYDSCKMVDGYAYIFVELYKQNEVGEKEYTEDEAAKLLAPTVCDELLPAEDVYMTDCERYNMYHIIATIDMNDMTKFHDVKAIIGESGSIQKYVSGSNIYIITDIRDEYRDVTEADTDDMEMGLVDQSEIIRLSYEKGNITPNGKTRIEGNVGDEFDIDEYNGYLRMAVSTRSSKINYKEIEVEYYDGKEWVKGTDLTYDIIGSSSFEGSALYILDEKLEIVGSIPKLKENEQVYGVRFDGDIAYVVTYEQTDPLFTIDLSEPTNPKVMGALKIPGFSTYLHKWDDNKLIGLGYDEQGYVKISTFDISDKYDVKETEVYSLEGVYWSEALYNHKAVFVSPEKNLIGFAMEEYSTNESYTDYEWSMVYKIFSYVDGKLTETIKCDVGVYSQDIRGLYIGEYIYIVTPEKGVAVYSMEDYSFSTMVN